MVLYQQRAYAPEVGDQQAEGEPASYVRFSTASAVFDENKVATVHYDGLHIWEISKNNLRASGPWNYESYDDNKYRSMFGDPDGEEYNWDEADDDDYDDAYGEGYNGGEEEYEEEDEREILYLGYAGMMGFIMREDTIVTMVNYESSSLLLLFYQYGDDEWERNEIVLHVFDEEADEDPIVQVPLLLDTGLLLYADGSGARWTVRRSRPYRISPQPNLSIMTGMCTTPTGPTR